MSWTLTTSGSAIIKAGAGASSIFLSGAYGTVLNKWSDQAEGKLCAATRRNWITLSGSTIASFSGILDDTVSDMVAMKIINYDMSGYTLISEAQTMLDVLRDNISQNIEILKDEKNKEKMVT